MHYRDLRAITVREAARFQAFPDTFVFHGHHSSQMRHVGNAVPPLMSKALAEQIMADLTAAEVGKERGPGRPKAIHFETPKQLRSRIMGSVHSKHTTPELKLRKALWKERIRGFRRHLRNLPGSPDFAFPADRVAVFVDGCFWHGCAKCHKEPKTNREYWTMKVQRNRDRDKKVTGEFRSMEWIVIRLWEHQVTADIKGVCRKIEKALRERRGLRQLRRRAAIVAGKRRREAMRTPKGGRRR